MRRFFCVWLLSTFVVLATSGFQSADLQSAELNRIGRKIDAFSLKSHFGKAFSLQDFADSDVVVVVFMGTECPLAKVYGPRLAELAAKLKDQRVAFVGIDSNRQDSIAEMAAYAHRHHIEFPLLKDPGNVVADQFGAARTPEVFVLDQQRVVRYRGRIDDQYGFADSVGYQRPHPTRNDLVEAVNEVLAKKPVSVAETKAIGCQIGRVRKVNESSEVTYSKQISRIFQANCVECHRAGRIGPFEMTSYDKVAGWGEMIREVVGAGRMPPWHANPAHGEFSNDSRLSDQDKQLIATWVDNGCPEGNPADLPAPRTFVEGWGIGQPDQVFYMDGKPVNVPAEGVIDYYHFVVNPHWTEDRWIKAAEAKPSSLETVHHILVFVLPPGVDLPEGQLGGGSQQGGESGAGNGEGDAPQELSEGGAGGGIGGGNLIAAYAPGANPLLLTDGTTAMHVKAGSKLLFQLHYTANGTAQPDRSYVGFRFADPEKVKYVARSVSIVNALFKIPAGARDYQATAEGSFETDTLLINMTPHLHSRGKAFRYEAIYPDGKQETLLDVPSYDFNWQTTYNFKVPKLMPKGSKLLCTAHWDNSERNLSNPDPTKSVSWGEQTFEEMMIGFYIEVFPKGQVPEQPSGSRGFGPSDPQKLFKDLDTNRDGKLDKDELPGPLAKGFSQIDANGDGAITEKELIAAFTQPPAGGQGAPATPPAKPAKDQPKR